MTSNKIALWGWYHTGNFGDDLMALLLYRWLQDRGYKPLVYGMPDHIANAIDVRATDSLDELLDSAILCVAGGGGLLLKNAACEENAGILAKQLRNRGMDFWAVSIGSDGTNYPLDWKSMPGRAALFSCDGVRGATVRVVGDANALVSKPAEYYPDVVLSAGKCLGYRRVQGRAIRIGLNLPVWGASPKLLRGLMVLRRLVPNLELAILRTTHESYPNKQEWCGFPDMPGVEVIPYRNVDQFCKSIASMDLVISFKLHLGVAAMSMGVPFVSYGGSDKVLSFLKTLNMAGHYAPCTRRGSIALVGALAKAFFAGFGLRRFDALLPKTLGPAIEGSMNHYAKLQEAIESAIERQTQTARCPITSALVAKGNDEPTC